MEKHHPWEAVVGEQITGFHVDWFESGIEGQELLTAPTALTLRFADSVSIAVVCGSWNGAERAVFPTSNDVVILWRSETLPVLVPYLVANLLDPSRT